MPIHVICQLQWPEQLAGRSIPSPVLWTFTNQQAWACLPSNLSLLFPSSSTTPISYWYWGSLAHVWVPQYNNVLLMLKWDFVELPCHHPIERGVVLYSVPGGWVAYCCNKSKNRQWLDTVIDVLLPTQPTLDWEASGRGAVGRTSLLCSHSRPQAPARCWPHPPPEPLSWWLESEKFGKAHLLSTALAQESHLTLCLYFPGKP